jgi:glycine cleavage system H protein
MSNDKEVRADRYYTRDHEWAKSTDSEVLVGISAFAVGQLGDITLVDLTVKPGDVLEQHSAIGTIESVKTLSDIFAPISGRVLRVNAELVEHPEWVNSDCWELGWMLAVEPTTVPESTSGLLGPAAYQKYLEESGH